MKELQHNEIEMVSGAWLFSFSVPAKQAAAMAVNTAFFLPYNVSSAAWDLFKLFTGSR